MFRAGQNPYNILIFGLFLLVLGIVGTCTGTAQARFGRVVYRAKEPKRYWTVIGIEYAGGVFLIGYFLYLIS